MRSPLPASIHQPSPESHIDLITKSCPNQEASSDAPQTKRAKATSESSNQDLVAKSVPASPMTRTKSNVRRIVSASAGSMRTHHQTSPTAQQISQALKAQRCPTNKEIHPLCKFLSM